jgi:heat shock protein HtpX
MSLGTTIYNRIDQNIRNTFLLMATFAVLLTTLIWVFAQAWGYDSFGALGLAGITLLITGVINLFSWYYSDKIALAVAQAREIDRENYPKLYTLIEGLCIGAGLPVPKIYLIDDTAPNAFATGRDPQHSAIAVTKGLIQKLDRRELEGVLAHELMHIQNRDTLYMTIVVILVGFIALLTDIFSRSIWYGDNRRKYSSSNGGGVFVLIGLLFALFTPLIAQLLKFAVSREREYLADASAALLTRYPEGLARALEKISADPEPLEVANKATAHMYIVNPLNEWQGVINNLFSTHPPIHERVARLRQM